VWTFVSGALGGAAASLVANRSLVQKVWFPREVLPLAAVGASLVNLFLQASVLLVGLLAFRNVPELRLLPLLVVAVVVLVVLTSGLALIVAALNVRYRDVQHLLDVSLLAWFWLSAVVYPYRLVADRLGDLEWLSTANPVLPVILTFQRVLYNPVDETVLGADGEGWFLSRLGVVAVVAVLTCIAGLQLFRRLEDDFGEQL
jgi:ABC-2 type transport system permease protein